MNDARPFDIPKALKQALAVLVLLAGAQGVWAQTGDKAALQKERDRITQQLKTTENLLSQAKRDRNNAAQQVSLLNKKIELRERLVKSHQATIRSLERSMRGTDTELRTLEGHVAALKDEYARMVQQAYRMKLGTNPLLFVFAAEDFSQAALRFRLVQSYTTVRKEQVKQIEEAQTDLAEVRVTLNEERAEVEQALAEQQAERDALRADKGERTALVDQLQAEEKRLRKAQKAQEKERQRLSDEIKRIIEAELAAERASAAGEFALTPEGKIVSEAFEKNQRSLPWPVMRGVVTQGFGRQPHPTLDRHHDRQQRHRHHHRGGQPGAEHFPRHRVERLQPSGRRHQRDRHPRRLPHGVHQPCELPSVQRHHRGCGDLPRQRRRSGRIQQRLAL